MAEPTLYLFDGHNLLYTGSFAEPRELVDQLASFVALSGRVESLNVSVAAALLLYEAKRQRGG